MIRIHQKRTVSFMKKIISVVCAVLVLLCMFTVPTFAVSFSHADTPNGKSEAIESREMYEATYLLTSNKLGLDKSLEGLTDICVGLDGYIYVLCG